MFDIGWQELFVVGIIAVIAIGPKDLPQAVRTFTRVIRKVRGMASEFQRGLDEVVREAEIDEIRKEITKTTEFDVTKELEKTIDPTGNMARELDMSDLQSDLDETARRSTALPSPERSEPAAKAPDEPRQGEGKTA